MEYFQSLCQSDIPLGDLD